MRRSMSAALRGTTLILVLNGPWASAHSYQAKTVRVKSLKGFHFLINPLCDKGDKSKIFINLDVVKKKSKEFDRTPKNYLHFVFIHSLLHLKGFDHSSRMESEEARVRALFKI